MFDLNNPNKRTSAGDPDNQSDELNWVSEEEMPTQPARLWPAAPNAPHSPDTASTSDTSMERFLSDITPTPDRGVLSEYHPKEFIYQERTPPPFPFPERRSHTRRNILLVLLVLLSVGGGALGSLALTGQGKWPWIGQHSPTPLGTPGISGTPVPTSVPPTTNYDLWVQTHGIMFGFDAQHTGFNPNESILSTATVSKLTPAWSSDAIGENVFSSPVVSGGLVYVSTYSGRFYALDSATGHVRWSSNAASSSTSSNVSTPAVINGMVYICLQDHRLYAFDAQHGTLLWTSPAGNEVNSSPIVANGVVYVSGNRGVDAFDAVTGKPRWSSSFLSSSYPPVAVANGIVYVSVSGNAAGTGRVSALDAVNGHLLWTSDLIHGGTDINSAPTVAHDLVYIGAGNGGIAAFDATNGHVRWVTPATTGSTGSSPEVANGVVYISEDKIYAFNASTGAALWTSGTIGAYNDDSPVIANGVLYVCTAATNGAYVGSVYALDASTGRILWVSPPTHGQIFTTPAVANGVVYIASGDQDGKLYAFHLPQL